MELLGVSVDVGAFAQQTCFIRTRRTGGHCMYDANRALGAPINRRCFVRTGLALGGLALTATLAGCDSFLGIEDPTAKVEDDPASQADPNTIDFESLTVTLNIDPASWTWDKIQNPQSANNGSLVVALPITVVNTSADQGYLLNAHYCKVISPDGQVQPDVSGYFEGSDILRCGTIAAGSTVQAVIHVSYRGSGTYQLEFDNMLGRKAQLSFELSGSQTSGLRALPDGDLGAASAQGAVPYGISFDVGQLTLAFSADEASYLWIQAWDSENAVWNGRWCVGVPLAIVNNGTVAQGLTADLYALYAPTLYRMEDAAPWFGDPSPDYVTSASYAGLIEPGQSLQTMLYWPYDGDGWYYAAFDNDGALVVASARIAQYS